eukprot:TRINITY_DN1503_c0_g1_i2.p1 TRINITY_DN1503_c0_g1~~TRINITY_DN1503_c0_g1_i2.p1  ORF type:complete len:254 (-),score=51.11 TRINITY_DN1503_c0_g1_i2:355-1116(-)
MLLRTATRTKTRSTLSRTHKNTRRWSNDRKKMSWDDIRSEVRHKKKPTYFSGWKQQKGILAALVAGLSGIGIVSFLQHYSESYTEDKPIEEHTAEEKKELFEKLRPGFAKLLESTTAAELTFPDYYMDVLGEIEDIMQLKRNKKSLQELRNRMGENKVWVSSGHWKLRSVGGLTYDDEDWNKKTSMKLTVGLPFSSEDGGSMKIFVHTLPWHEVSPKLSSTDEDTYLISPGAITKFEVCIVNIGTIIRVLGIL